MTVEILLLNSPFECQGHLLTVVLKTYLRMADSNNDSATQGEQSSTNTETTMTSIAWEIPPRFSDRFSLIEQQNQAVQSFAMQVRVPDRFDVAQQREALRNWRTRDIQNVHMYAAREAFFQHIERSYYCYTCNMHLNGLFQYREHIGANRHSKRRRADLRNQKLRVRETNVSKTLPPELWNIIAKYMPRNVRSWSNFYAIEASTIMADEVIQRLAFLQSKRRKSTLGNWLAFCQTQA